MTEHDIVGKQKQSNKQELGCFILHNEKNIATVANRANRRKAAMDISVKDLYQRLIDRAIYQADTAQDKSELKQFLAAMKNPENVTFASETLYGSQKHQGKRPSAEQLLRVKDMDGAFMETALKQLNEMNDLDMIHTFDTAVTVAAVDYAIQEKRFPISINVSTRNIETPTFWTDLHALLQSHFYDYSCCKPSDITFELLEDDPRYFETLMGDKTYAAKIEFVREFKKKHGYSLSMDDLTDKIEDSSRFALYKDLVDKVKLDWHTTERVTARTADPALTERLAFCKKNEKLTVAEGVQNPLHAISLRQEFGINCFQGRELTNRDAFNAEFNAACLPEAIDPEATARKQTMNLLLGASRPALACA